MCIRDRVNVHQRSLSSFLKTAEVLRVSGLTQQTEVRDEVSVVTLIWSNCVVRGDGGEREKESGGAMHLPT